ncbi:MAG: NAD-dependent epimerase/dehydratase family protein [Candidatus Nanohaloarchaea archaeon]
MKVMVTGGAGFIGSSVAREHLENDDEVLVIDDLSIGERSAVPEDAEFRKIDIRDQEAVLEAVEEFDPDVINHHAAHNDAMDSLEEPVKDADINILGSINLLEAARKHDINKVVYASSGGLSYGEPREIPTPETHEMHPSYPYGISKHSVEHYLELYRELYDLDFVVLRYASVYGPGANGGVIKNFLEAVEKGERPMIFGDGTQTRDFIHVDDVSAANHLASRKGSGYYNIGTQTEITINNLWKLTKDITGFDKDAKHDDRWLGDIDRCRLDCSKAKKDLGWESQVDLEDGIRRLYRTKKLS